MKLIFKKINIYKRKKKLINIMQLTTSKKIKMKKAKVVNLMNMETGLKMLILILL